MKLWKKILLFALTAALLCAGTACQKNDSGDATTEATAANVVQKDGGVLKTGTVVIELYPEYAPQTVKNFLKLVNSGFYNGLTFHRIVNDFMAQGGDPEGSGNGGAAEQLNGEFAANGYTQNTLGHDKGVISMARGQDYNSASSQFFICLSNTYQSSLDGLYAAFGKVVSGMETIEDLQNTERTPNSFGEIAVPVQPVTMTKVVQLSDFANATDGHSYVQMTITYTVK